MSQDISKARRQDEMSEGNKVKLLGALAHSEYELLNIFVCSMKMTFYSEILEAATNYIQTYYTYNVLYFFI